MQNLWADGYTTEFRKARNFTVCNNDDDDDNDKHHQWE
jgi:hypothetical protein